MYKPEFFIFSCLDILCPNQIVYIYVFAFWQSQSKPRKMISRCFLCLILFSFRYLLTAYYSFSSSFLGKFVVVLVLTLSSSCKINRMFSQTIEDPKSIMCVRNRSGPSIDFWTTIEIFWHSDPGYLQLANCSVFDKYGCNRSQTYCLYS